MKSDEFNHWLSNFNEALRILTQRDPESAKDLRQNTRINTMKKTMKYIGSNRDLAACFLPADCLPYERKKWRRGD
jgi:hypothetical protein